MSNGELVLEDWRRWLYIDGFLGSLNGDHPRLVAVLSGELCCWLDGELWNRTGHIGGRRLPEFEGPGGVYEFGDVLAQMNDLRTSVLLHGPYVDVPLEIQLAVTVIGNYIRHLVASLQKQDVTEAEPMGEEQR